MKTCAVRGIVWHNKGVRMLGLILLAVATAGQAAPEPKKDLKPFTFKYPAQDLKLWLPEPYELDFHVTHRFIRKPTIAIPDLVTLRLDLRDKKAPLEPVPPTEADLMRVNTQLASLKFTSGVETWRGRQVAVARYEGFIGGNIGVFGRMIWLPLQPGTVVIDLWAEPSWVPTMNQDWDLILANIEGPIAEITLRERAPGRWLAAKIVAFLGYLLALAGVIMILARMNESLGGVVVLVGFLFPLIPLGYALFHLYDCRRGLLIVLSGVAVFGGSLLMEL